MDEQEVMLRKLAQNENSLAREAEQYEEAVKKIPYGTLNSFDVCRLFGGPKAAWSKNPGALARQLVAKNDLPLAELSPGRFIISHTVDIPEGAL